MSHEEVLNAPDDRKVRSRHKLQNILTPLGQSPQISGTQCLDLSVYIGMMVAAEFVYRLIDMCRGTCAVDADAPGLMRTMAHSGMGGSSVRISPIPSESFVPPAMQ